MILRVSLLSAEIVCAFLSSKLLNWGRRCSSTGPKVILRCLIVNVLLMDDKTGLAMATDQKTKRFSAGKFSLSNEGWQANWIYESGDLCIFV